MNWKIVDSEMTPWRTKIKDLQIERGIGSSEDYSPEGCFHCEHWEGCYKSICKKNKVEKNKVSKGEWTYVGHQYGEASVNGKKAKILFVSMLKQIWDENKLKKGEDFESVQKSFRTSALERIIPHMGGTDVELEHLLDKGTSCEDRCQQFALTNAVRCCFRLGAPYHARSTMEKNCEHHTEAIIQALKPDIIIAQGTNPRQSMCRLFDLDIKESYDNGRTGPQSRSVEIGQCEGFLFLLTAHPANTPGFGWKTGYLPDELKKAFKRAREIYSGTVDSKKNVEGAMREPPVRDGEAIKDFLGIPNAKGPYPKRSERKESDKGMQPMPEVQATQKPDRLFNTNETREAGAYVKMFDQRVIAIYGYPNGSQNLEGSTEGQRVFAYVDGKGILAVGKIADSEPVSGNTVFGGYKEFHVKVDWETIVDAGEGVTYAKVKAKGYHLPVRGKPFVEMLSCPSDVADWIADKLRRRAK